MHLNVFIAKSGYCARRKAGVLIKDGKVRVNGKVVREPWHEVGERDEIAIAGKKLSQEKKVYLIVNKPKGVTTTLDDVYAEKKISDIIPKRYGRLFPVGRLDRESRGLIILTNDGDLCYKLTHPKFGVEKEYRALVKGRVDGPALSKLRKGVWSEEEVLKVKSIMTLDVTDKKTSLIVVATEGKKRHIRRLFEAAGFPVLDLMRVRIGKLSLDGSIRAGGFRTIGRDDIYRLTLDEA